MFYWIDNPAVPILYVLAVIGSGILGAIIIWDGFSDQYSWQERNKSDYGSHLVVDTAKRRKLWFKWSLIVFAGCVVVGNIGTAVFSPRYVSDPRTITYQDASAHFGLESGKAYPLMIGGMFGSVEGTAATNVDFFGANTTVDLKPATAITVSFTHDNSSWILTLPTNTVTFHQQADAEPTMTLTLNSNPYASASWDQHLSDCNWGFANLAIACVRWPTQTPEVIMNDDADKDGLPKVVSQSFVRAEITLPPDLYDKVVRQQ